MQSLILTLCPHLVSGIENQDTNAAT